MRCHGCQVPAEQLLAELVMPFHGHPDRQRGAVDYARPPVPHGHVQDPRRLGEGERRDAQPDRAADRDDRILGWRGPRGADRDDVVVERSDQRTEGRSSRFEVPGQPLRVTAVMAAADHPVIAVRHHVPHRTAGREVRGIQGARDEAVQERDAALLVAPGRVDIDLLPRGDEDIAVPVGQVP